MEKSFPPYPFSKTFYEKEKRYFDLWRLAVAWLEGDGNRSVLFISSKFFEEEYEGELLFTKVPPRIFMK